MEVKRAKIILTAVVIVTIAALLLAGSGTIRTFIDNLTHTKAMAQDTAPASNAGAAAPADAAAASEPTPAPQPAEAETATASADQKVETPADADTGAAGTAQDAAGAAADTAPATEAADQQTTAAAEVDDQLAADAGEDTATAAPAGMDPNRPGGQRFFAPRSDRFDPEMMRRYTEAGGDPNRPFDRSRMRDMMPRGDRRRGSLDGPSAEQSSEEDPMESVNLVNVEMKKIIQMLGEWTQKPIIPVNDEIMNTRITIYSPKQVRRSQAMTLIMAALKAKGVILEQSDDKIIIKPIAAAKLGSVPTLSAEEPLARITDKAQIVEKFFRLSNYSPSKIMTIITPLIAEYGHVTAMEDTGQVAVIDSVENLIRIERIIRQLDVPESEQVVEEIFTLESGDPLEVVQVLQLILDTERRSRSSSFRPPSAPSSAAGSAASKPAASVIVTAGEVPIRLIPIPKHNWIIARASAVDMEQIRSWIKKLDRAETVRSEQTVVQVKYVDVREVANIIEDTLRDMPGTDFRTSVVVQPLVQAKQLVIFGSEENRKMVEKLVAEVDLPLRDVFIERTFKLKYADPDQIKANIDGLYGDAAMRAGSYNYYSYTSSRGRPGTQDEELVKVISYPTQQQITVIASEKNMQKIARQIEEEWDVPLDIEKDQYRILTLYNSDPVQMANLLSRLFSEQGDSSRNLINMIFYGRGATDTQKKIVGSLYGQLTFEPIPDTKKIIVISKIAEAYDVIEKLVAELDSEEKAEVPRVITLNYADAEDLCDQLNAILNEPGTLATLNRTSRGLSAYQASSQSDSATSRPGGGASGGGGDTAGTITPWWTRARTNTTEEMPTSNLIGRVRFIPVARSKAILVLAPPEYFIDIQNMIAELDQPGMQVMIKIVIVEVDHQSMTSLGVQLTSNPGLFNNLGPGALLALTELTTGYTRGSMSAITGQGNSGLSRMMPFGFSSGMNVDILVEALTKTVNAKVLNQPTLWTKDNQEAIFVKGQRVAFIQQRITDRQTTGSTTETFLYDDVGLTLRVRPNITPEKAVDMSINLIVSQVGEPVNNQLATNQLDTTTHIIVNDGQTILLGGILFQNDNVVVNKIPLLGDLPLLGGLFRHKSNTLRNNELLAFVTPYVMDANSLVAIPADLDDSRQLHEPLHKKDRIQKDLQDAVDWMSDEIIQEIDEAKPFFSKPASRQDDAVVEIKAVSEPAAQRPETPDHTTTYVIPPGK